MSTVTKTNSLSELKTILKDSELQAASQLKAIVNFLKDKEESVVPKHQGWYECRNYRFKMGTLGFVIKDMLNFGKTPKKWDTENLMPTPREVFEFIIKPLRTWSEEPKVATEEVGEKVEKVKKVLYLQKGESFSPAFPPKEEVPIKVEATKESLDALKPKAIRKIKMSKNLDKMMDDLYTMFDHRGFRVLYNKLTRKFAHGEIRKAKFITELIDLITNADFSPKRDPAPKFVGLQWHDITELEELEDKVTFTVNKVRLSWSKSEFLAKYILHKYPEAMPQMMKFLNKEISFEDFIESPIKKDRFVHYDSKLLSDNEELEKICIEFLESLNDEQPLLVMFSNHIKGQLKKGDKVKIKFLDSCSSYKGKVIDTIGGIEILFEDGSISKLLKHQPWQKEQELQK